MAKRKRAIIVSFVGMDGTGKTTQAKALVDILQRRGIRCSCVHNKFEPILTKPFIVMGKMLFFRGRGKFDDFGRYTALRRRVFKNRLLATGYQYLVLFDHSLQIRLRLRPFLKRNDVIVCDRYIYDSVVDLAAELNCTGTQVKSMLGRALALLPKPELAFLMDAPEETAYQRKDDTPALDFLKERRQIYLAMAKELNMKTLVSTKSLDELRELVAQEVADYMREC